MNDTRIRRESLRTVIYKIACNRCMKERRDEQYYWWISRKNKSKQKERKKQRKQLVMF
jgi:hypothetical protein